MENELKYEEAIKELEIITKKLENGELSLEEALSYFAKGVELIKVCRSKLDGAKEKVSIITKDVDDELSEKDFSN